MAVRPNTNLLKEKRQKLNLTQLDIAWKLQQMGIKVTDNHYSRIERGEDEYRNIHINTAFAIAHILKEPIDKLFIFTPDAEPASLTPSQKKRLRKETRPTIKQALGRRLKEVRKQNKIPIQKLADHLGCHASYIYFIENGQASIELMKKYGEFVGLDVEELAKLDSPLEK